MSTPSRSLARQTAFVTAGQSAAKLADFLTAMLLVRILTSPEWATMALFFSIYSVATGLGGMNLQQAIYFFYGRLPAAERRSLAVQTTGLLALTGLATSLLVLGLGPLLADSRFGIAGLLPWLALTLLLEIPTLGAPQLLLAADRAGWSATFTAAAALVRVVAVTVPLWLGQGLRGAVLGLLGYAVLRVVAYAAILTRVMPPGPLRFRLASVREQVRYTLPLGLSLATTLLNRDVGKWIVAGLDPVHFGAYAIAATEVPFIAILPYAIGAVLATRLVESFHRGQAARAQAYWFAATARATFVVVPLTLAIILCARELLVLLFTSGYASAVLPFQIVSLILLHRVAEYGGMLRAAGDTRALWIASSILLGGNLLLGFPLTLAFGMVGTALGALAANLLAWGFALARIARSVNSSVVQVFPWPIYLRVLATAGVAAAATALIARPAPDHPVVQLVLKAGLFTGLYLVGVALLGLRHGLPSLPAEPEAGPVPEGTGG